MQGKGTMVIETKTTRELFHCDRYACYDVYRSAGIFGIALSFAVPPISIPSVFSLLFLRAVKLLCNRNIFVGTGGGKLCFLSEYVKGIARMLMQLFQRENDFPIIS